MNGWIKLHRSILDWEWYGDINTKVLFLHLLLKSNTKDKYWKSNLVQRGQCISSYQNLADETGLTVSQVRLSVNKLRKTGELTHLNCGKFGLFTVINYDRYQLDDRLATGSEQADNRLVTTTKEGKKEKKERKVQEYTQAFEIFYEAYPRKIEKANCFEKYKARLKDGFSEAQLLEAAIKYANKCKKDGTTAKYIKHGATFLSVKKPFLDYLNEDVKYDEKSAEYRLSRYFEQYRKAMDPKFSFTDIQEQCELFHLVLENGRNPNEIWAVMKALFSSDKSFLIKKYIDVEIFCRRFSEVGSSLALDRKDDM